MPGSTNGWDERGLLGEAVKKQGRYVRPCVVEGLERVIHVHVPIGDRRWWGDRRWCFTVDWHSYARVLCGGHRMSILMIAPPQHLHDPVKAVDQHFGGVTVLAILILPLAGLQLAFHIDL